MAHPKAPARTTERVEAEVAVPAAVAAVIAVIRTGDLCIPAAAKAPKKTKGDVPAEHGIKKKSLGVARCPKAPGSGSEVGKIPSTKILTRRQEDLMVRP